MIGAQIKLYIIGAAVLAFLGLLGTSFVKGVNYEKMICNTAALKAQNKAMERDLSIAKSSAEEAKKRTAELTEIVSSNEQEIAKYEVALRNVDMVCAADDADVALDRRLRRVAR